MTSLDRIIGKQLCASCCSLVLGAGRCPSYIQFVHGHSLGGFELGKVENQDTLRALLHSAGSAEHMHLMCRVPTCKARASAHFPRGRRDGKEEKIKMNKETEIASFADMTTGKPGPGVRYEAILEDSTIGRSASKTVRSVCRRKNACRDCLLLFHAGQPHKCFFFFFV